MDEQEIKNKIESLREKKVEIGVEMAALNEELKKIRLAKLKERVAKLEGE